MEMKTSSSYSVDDEALNSSAHSSPVHSEVIESTFLEKPDNVVSDSYKLKKLQMSSNKTEK